MAYSNFTLHLYISDNRKGIPGIELEGSRIDVSTLKEVVDLFEKARIALSETNQ